MSPVARNNLSEADDHRDPIPLYGSDIADQQEEDQSTRSELPAEIPDSQPDYIPYLPAEIPDSQPDVVYHDDTPTSDLDYLDYLEVSSQPPTGDNGDLHLRDANDFDLGDYDLSEEQEFTALDRNLDEQGYTDSRVNRFERFHREEVDGEDTVSSTSSETEIIPGGTRLTERSTGRIVSLYNQSPIRSTLLSQHSPPCIEHYTRI